MGQINFNVDAADMTDVLRQLDILGRVPERATAALMAGANIILPAAKNLAPVRTGKMKAAIRIGRRGKNRNRYAVEVGVFHGDAPQAHLVEHGHGGPKPAPAHAFLEPAVEMTEAQVTDAIMKELTKGL